MVGKRKYNATSLGVKAHFQIKLNQTKASPYLIAGSSARLDIKNENNYPLAARNLALDIGYGLENSFKDFKMSPEFVYSYGLVNVHPIVDGTYYHKLSLILNFKG